MIEITGTINGELYEDRRMTADQIIDLFGLPVNGQDRIIFRLNEKNKNVVAKNLADGKPRFPVKQGLITTFNGMYNGSSIQVRYYERKVERSKGEVRYFPDKVYFDGLQTSFNLDRDREKAVFMMLFPWCKESPFRPPRKAFVYQVHDRVKNAKAKLTDNVKFAEVMENIMKSSDDLIRQVAYGIKVKGKRVNHEDAKFPATARMALLDMARENPADTYNAFHSTAVRMAGAVIDAKEQKKIKSRVSGGKVYWEFSDDLGGDVFVEFKNHGDAVAQLIKHLSDVNNWNAFTSRVYDGADIETEVPAEPADMENSELIDTAIRAKVLTIHPKEDKVYLMDENSQFESRALMILDGGREGWKEELAQNMSAVQRNRILKKLS